MRRKFVMKTMSMSAFQSTHPRGVRRFKDDVSVCLGVFQSTHPRGVRPDERYHQSEHRRISIHAPARGATSKGAEHFHDHFDFNPRTREGCDHIGRRAVYRYLIFQSTHPRGVRLKGVYDSAGVYRKFQSTHPRGVRPYLVGKLTPHVEFQSTHPRGVRPVV